MAEDIHARVPELREDLRETLAHLVELTGSITAALPPSYPRGAFVADQFNKLASFMHRFTGRLPLPGEPDAPTAPFGPGPYDYWPLRIHRERMEQGAVCWEFRQALDQLTKVPELDLGRGFGLDPDQAKRILSLLREAQGILDEGRSE